jgi:endo-1,4-beta-mannosidase
VRTFVKRFKHHPAILAWDLGNECNVMAQAPSRQAAWAWTAAITGAIRAADPSRPVVSGMHSLLPDRRAPWTMQDQAELTDLLTTHPYPYFTPHCDQDPVNTIRTLLHSTAESRFYADIGGAPCLVEEIGTLGPILASEQVAADFVRAALFSIWAHDCHGLLWWCAFDQLHLEHAPYDWAACERELGLLRRDGSPKPALVEIGKFARFLQGIDLAALPPRRGEAVCILSEGQDAWGVAYSSFVLAKQAGFDLEFQYADQPLRPASLYLMPSVRGMHAISRRRWLELLGRVEAGATLYLSHHDCLLSPFDEPF